MNKRLIISVKIGVDNVHDDVEYLFVQVEIGVDTLLLTTYFSPMVPNSRY